WSAQASSFEFVAHALDDFAHFDVLMAARPYLASDLSDQILLARAFARCLLAWRHRSKDGRPDLCERRPPDVEDEVSLVIGATNERAIRPSVEIMLGPKRIWHRLAIWPAMHGTAPHRGHAAGVRHCLV